MNESTSFKDQHPSFAWNIGKIFIIRNSHLYKEYLASRDGMLSRRDLSDPVDCTCNARGDLLPGGADRHGVMQQPCKALHEKYLWHGCSFDSSRAIAMFGFVPGFSKRQLCGAGTYFAGHSHYPLFEPSSSVPSPSAKLDDAFTPVHHMRDGSITKTLILARVLGGEACRGKRGMVLPLTSRLPDRYFLGHPAPDHHVHPSPTPVVLFSHDAALSSRHRRLHDHCETMMDKYGKMVVVPGHTNKNAYPQFIVQLENGGGRGQST